MANRDSGTVSFGLYNANRDGGIFLAVGIFVIVKGVKGLLWKVIRDKGTSPQECPQEWRDYI